MNHYQSHLKREARYGLPTADQILYNRHYILGYSYHFRQAKWALEIIDPDRTDLERSENFRPDYRIPERFRADKEVYIGSDYHRGHLVASANQWETEIQNSETFLLSNMCPQVPAFNTGIWKKLEEAVRKLNSDKKVLETYVISGPLFLFDQEVKMIGDDNEDISVSLPIPHEFFKCILIEKSSGVMDMWAFRMPNKGSTEKLETFLVPTAKIEKISGLLLWETLLGTKMNAKKNRVKKMWKY